MGTFGNTNKDKEKKFREEARKRVEDRVKKAKEYDEKMRDPIYRLDIEIADLKRFILAAEYDVNYGNYGELRKEQLADYKRNLYDKECVLEILREKEEKK